MKKTLAAIFVVLIVVVIGVCASLHNGKIVPAQVLVKDYKDTAYVIASSTVDLTDGYSEVPAAPGSASKIITKYFGNEARGDLNGDGVEDVAFLLTQETGGSGTFYYIVAALGDKNGGYTGTNGIFLGDRIAPQTTEIKNGEITVNYAERKTGAPMTSQPNIGVSKHIHLLGGNLVVIK